MSMRKIIPVLAVLGSAVAFAVYKLKKEEQKRLMDLDEDLLVDEEEPSFKKYEEPIVHEPVHQEAVTPVHEEVNIAKEIEPNFAPKADASDIKKMMEETKAEMQAQEVEKEEAKVEPTLVKPIEVDDILKDVEESYTSGPDLHLEKEETNEDETFSSEYPNLTNRMVKDINSMTLEAIEALAKDGDVHEHERPVQHMVSFKAKEDLEMFKSKVINRGFVITKGEAEFDLVVLHISMIDEEKLVSNILYLADQAYAYNGEYRGWQSKVSY